MADFRSGAAQKMSLEHVAPGSMRGAKKENDRVCPRTQEPAQRVALAGTLQTIKNNMALDNPK